MTIETIKFSQMTDGGDIDNNKKVPGLKDGGNVLFNNPWTFLPSGTTAQRPAPSAEVNYRLRLNTEAHLYEYYDAVLGQWIQLQASAVTAGPFITYTDDSSLPDAQNLGALANGILKQTITLGVATLDIALNGTDYWAPGDALTRTQVPLIGNDVTNKTYVDAQIAGSVVSLEGTANQVLVNGTSGSPQTGVLVLTTPQDTAPASTPSFAGLTMSGNISLGGVARTTNALEPVNPSDYATKFYVDQNSLNGTQVYAASAGSLGTVTQSGSGVGATLTNAGVQATFSLDGVNPPLNSVVLIKDTATGMTAANEGIYTVSNVGSGATNWVLTRATSYDTATEINNTGLIVVQNGSTLQGTAWYNTATIVTVDTTNFNYMEFGNITFPISLAHGGTNANLTASNGGIVYSTSTELAILSGTPTANKVLMSGSSGAPSWSIPTYPSASGTLGKLIISDGTNNVYSTSTFPTSAGATAGKIIVSDGTNYVLSTPTFPNASATSRKIIVSDGTNWVASTETYATPGTSGNVLTSNGTNWVSSAPTGSGTVNSGLINQLAYYAAAGTAVSGLSIVNSAVLTTTSGGVPTWVAYTGTNAPVLGTAPTISNPQINAIYGQTFNGLVHAFTDVASSVNYVNSVAGATGTPVGFQFTGSDSNVLAAYTTKGTGSHNFYNGLSVSTAPLFVMSGAATNTVNYITATGVVTGSSPAFSATGSDSNIGININSKGTGRVAIQGISTNTAQSAGYVGEFLSASNTTGAPIVFTTSVAKSLQNVTLTPGDWDVWGNVFVTGTTVTGLQVSLSTTNNTQADGSLSCYMNPVTTAANIGLPAPQQRFLVSSNTTVYVVGTVSGTGTLNASGGIYARRRS